jgi:hypothetical protein
MQSLLGLFRNRSAKPAFLPTAVLWLAATVAILALDFFLTDVDFAPVAIIPLLGFMKLLRVRTAIALALVLSAVVVVIETVSDHRPSSPLQIGANVGIMAFAYVLAVLVIHLLRVLIAETRQLVDAVRSLQSAAPRLFPAVGGEMFGWQIDVIDARRPHVRREFHQLQKDVDGCELIVGDVSAPGLNDMLVLSAMHGVFSGGPENNPVARLRSLTRQLSVIEGSPACKTWCGFLGSDGVVQYASGGYGATIVHRSDGTIETHEGDEEDGSQVKLIVLERGERALVAGDGLMALIEECQIDLLQVFEAPAEAEAKIHGLPGAPHAFGILIERRSLGPIDRLRRELLSSHQVR